MKEKSCSKFRRSSLNTAIAILRGLSDGLYPAQIARQIGRRRSLIHYYTDIMENMGFIEKQEGVAKDGIKARGIISLYRLTESGSTFLAGIEQNVQRCQVRLHNCYWLYPIVEQPVVQSVVDARRVLLKVVNRYEQIYRQASVRLLTFTDESSQIGALNTMLKANALLCETAVLPDLYSRLKELEEKAKRGVFVE